MRWQELLRQNFTSIEALAAFLELDREQCAPLLKKPKFPLNLPFRLAEKIKKGTLDDPLLKQFLPMNEELIEAPGFCPDPVGDLAAAKSGKLLHKYPGRALLTCTSACAMHCRYCFRQNFPYEKTIRGFEKELEYIACDESLREVILSGGDPLSLSNRLLKELIEALEKIPHLKKLRFHTRFPLGIPERVDEGFCEMLAKCRLQPFIVLHCNHPRELDREVLEAFSLMKQSGAVLLNQAVLLKDVNDNSETLKELCETLSDHGVLPYYLHQLDRVFGAARFEVVEERGNRLIEELRKSLPGYAVPQYVKEVPQEMSKLPV